MNKQREKKKLRLDPAMSQAGSGWGNKPSSNVADAIPLVDFMGVGSSQSEPR